MVGRSAILAAGLAGVLFLLLALLGLHGQGPGAAGGAGSDKVAPRCHAYSDAPLPFAEAERRLEWHCTQGGWQDGRAVTWLRFESRDAEGWGFDGAPTRFTSRTTVFRSIALAALDADGTVRVRQYGGGEARPLLAGPLFAVDLPVAGDTTRAFLVRIERPHSVTVASEASLRGDAPVGDATVSLVLLSLVAGMLVMPLLFDIMYFWVLRERFVLLHAGMIVAMIVYVANAGGIVTAFAMLPVPLLAIAGPLSFALGAALAGLFITAFLEPGKLPRRLERMVNALAVLSGLGAGACALQLEASQAFDNRLYFLLLLPLLPAYLAAIGIALWRGSRAARYLAFAFVPIFAAGAERMVRGMGFYAAQGSIDHAMFFALGMEVIIVTLGVADRFLAIRRERDQAVVRARTLKRLSERDQLTGLLNRRVVEDRFEMLREEGFTTLAVLDLDHFKRVNDTLGHAGGDRVLKVAGGVLASEDENMMAFRMGGEEFLLLVRGADGVRQAEERRQQITRAVAMEDLGCLVTASMGLVELTGGALPGAGFATLYARADRLLYEAKASGRNRMVCERIRVFQPRTRERRAA